MYTYTYSMCECKFTCSNMQICSHHKCIHMYTCVCKHTYIHTYVHIQDQVHTCTRTHTHAFYIITRTHAHTHTRQVTDMLKKRHRNRRQDSEDNSSPEQSFADLLPLAFGAKTSQNGDWTFGQNERDDYVGKDGYYFPRWD